MNPLKDKNLHSARLIPFNYPSFSPSFASKHQQDEKQKKHIHRPESDKHKTLSELHPLREPRFCGTTDSSPVSGLFFLSKGRDTHAGEAIPCANIYTTKRKNNAEKP